MHIKWRKINKVIHRDLGYFFCGMIIIYSISGIALNHINDWNPNYTITHHEERFTPSDELISGEHSAINEFLNSFHINKNKYKSHFSPSPGQMKIFLEEESTITIDSDKQILIYESIRRRPFFYEINFLHYNPGTIWKWFSDIFALSLIIIAISGLFILKGKNGITRRGAWLTIIGVIIPIILLFTYI